jgi:hypothetical protein
LLRAFGDDLDKGPLAGRARDPMFPYLEMGFAMHDGLIAVWTAGIQLLDHPFLNLCFHQALFLCNEETSTLTKL